jgi:hypothetical protein
VAPDGCVPDAGGGGIGDGWDCCAGGEGCAAGDGCGGGSGVTTVVGGTPVAGGATLVDGEASGTNTGPAPAALVDVLGPVGRDCGGIGGGGMAG